MYSNQLCTCDTSDTDGSDPGYGDSLFASGANDYVYNGGGGVSNDPNFQMGYDPQAAQNWGQPNGGYSNGQQNGKQPSFSSPMRASQQLQQAMQAPQDTRRTSQQMADTDYKVAGPLPGCTCPSGKRPSTVQAQASPQKISLAAKTTNASNRASSLSQIRGPPAPPDYRASQMGQGANGNGAPPMDYAPPENVPPALPRQSQQGYSDRRASQNGFGQPRMSAANQRLSAGATQPNGQGCSAPVCQGGAPRRASQTNEGGGGQNGNGLAQAQGPPPQLINPCCVRQPPPPPPPPAEPLQNEGNGNGCNCSAPPPPPPPANEGGNLCYCSTNMPQEEPPAEQSNGSDVCPSCAEFESDPNSVPECPPEDTGEETADTEAPPPVEEPPPPPAKVDSGKKSGFVQQLQFQVCQGYGDGGPTAKANEVNSQPPESNPNNGNTNDGNTNNGNTNNGNTMASNVDSNGNTATNNGKKWQQLTLDIFQTCSGGGSDDAEKSQGGWQQQLRLMIYQECTSDSNGAGTTNTANGEESAPADNEAENQGEAPPPPPESECGCE